MISLINHDSRVRSQWGRYNLPRYKFQRFKRLPCLPATPVVTMGFNTKPWSSMTWMITGVLLYIGNPHLWDDLDPIKMVILGSWKLDWWLMHLNSNTLLVGGIPTPLKNISQLGWLTQYMEKTKPPTRLSKTWIHDPKREKVTVHLYDNFARKTRDLFNLYQSCKWESSAKREYQGPAKRTNEMLSSYSSSS